jgi:hypothetical protein
MQIALSVPKNVGRGGLYETAFVAPGRLMGGQLFYPSSNSNLSWPLAHQNAAHIASPAMMERDEAHGGGQIGE